MTYKSFICLGFVCFSTLCAQAGVAVYKSKFSVVLYLQKDLRSKTDEAYLKFSGADHPWADKIVKVQAKNGRYFFKYFIDLSSGKKESEYILANEDGAQMIQGTMSPRLVLYLQHKKTLEFFHNIELTDQNNKLDLAQEYKKSPYTPDVE